MAWTYSNWITNSQAAGRLTALRTHCQEVADAIATGSVAADGLSYNPSFLQMYLESLLKMEKALTVTVAIAGRYTRGRLVLQGYPGASQTSQDQIIY